MHVIVCVKQVPSVEKVRVDPETGRIAREEAPTMINPEDRNALEEALRVKEKLGWRVTALSMGPPQAEEALREALAMGADRAVLVSDPALAGSDAFVTSRVLAEAAKRLQPFKLILCGSRSVDGETGMVGIQLAEELGLPQVTWAVNLTVEGDTVTAGRWVDGWYEVVEARLPAVVTVVGEINKPRYPTMRGIMEACRRKTVEVVTLKDLGILPSSVGLNGSPTVVERVFQPERRRGGIVLRGSVDELARKVAEVIVRELARG